MKPKKYVWLGILTLVFAACAPVAEATPTAVLATAIVAATATPVPTAQTAAAPTATPKPTPAPTATPAGPKLGGILRYAHRSDPPSWDLSISYHDPTSTSRSMVFSRLFTEWAQPPRDCQTPLSSLTVKDWRWIDDTTAEFTLRSGMKYHNKPPVNGREVVASDVAATFTRYRDLSPMAALSAQIESVGATDKYTFQIKTKVPFGGLLTEYLAHYYGLWIEPPEAGGPEGQWWAVPEKSWIGSGSFMFEKWLPGVKWTMVRNPVYWVQGRPYLDRIEWLVMPDVSARVSALRTSRIDMDRDPPPTQVADLKRTRPDIQVRSCSGQAMTGASILFMNNRLPPFDKVLVRRAAAMAIDHQTIIDKLYGGTARSFPVLPATAPYAMTRQDFPPQLQEYLTYDPQKAKELLAQAGYPNGVDAQIVWHLRYGSPAPETTEAVQQMLRKVGIRAEIKIIDYTIWISWINKPFEFEAGVMAMAPAIVNYPGSGDGLISFWSKEKTRNRSAVVDPEYDALFERFFSERDEAKRKELARQMQIMAVDRMYRIPMPFADSTMVAQPGIHYTWPGNTRDYTVMLETAWRE